ncbi:MAG: aminotransferase class I/II-fold pyridoxal phosphate-dependent enzyme [Propionibacteriaceae bacterium]|nr:aminotransferase class I/II-fold pyridoxal phosphate-dependent enzyme [Propionibacteriaceae bacterium]
MTIFNVPLDVLARRRSMKWRRHPPDVLPLWVAEMDCYLSPNVQRAIQEALLIGDFGYHGPHILEPAWRRYARDAWGLDLEERQIELSLDVMAAMAAAVDHLTPKDAVIATTTPIYPPFRDAGTVGGRRLVTVDMTPEGRFDLTAIDKLFAQEKPAMFLVCNPYNPHGTIATCDQLAAIAAMGARWGVTILVDEIHALVHDRHVGFTPYLTVPGSEAGFVATSASKGFGLAGLKVGLLVAGPAAVDSLARIPYANKAGSAGHLALIAQAAALDGDRDWLDQMNHEVVANKSLLADLLTKVGLRYTPSPATYFAWIDCSRFGLDDPAAHFLKEGRVAFNSGAEYDPRFRQWIRINVAASAEVLREAVRRLAQAL